MEINKKHKGALAELTAISWLLKQGYEVYRNVSYHGICDIVASKGGELLKIDVKTANNYLRTGKFYVSQTASDEQVAHGVKVLGVLFHEGYETCVWAPEESAQKA